MPNHILIFKKLETQTQTSLTAFTHRTYYNPFNKVELHKKLVIEILPEVDEEVKKKEEREEFLLVRSWVVERESVKIELLKITSGLGETPDSRSISLSLSLLRGRRTKQSFIRVGGLAFSLYIGRRKGGRESYIITVFVFDTSIYFISLK